MRRRARAVIGALFGDEGKGRLVDYYASRGADIVVRSNGGAQAGHTVQTPGGRRHVFSHFGSGTLLGVPTFLSRFFVASPLHFCRELAALIDLGATPRVTIDPASIVTTPYDIMLNQWAEEARGDARHGSCGMGFGETIERNEHGFTLIVDDLSYPSLAQRLGRIAREYVPKRMAALGLALTQERARMLRDEAILERFCADVGTFLDTVTIATRPEELRSGRIIFEGAQGLLLDQKRGFFPHVTRSYTGLRNMLALAHEWRIDQLDVTYAARAYATRHGAGPMPHELPVLPFSAISDPTNRPNPHQGALRFGWLDLDLLGRAIREDMSDVPAHLQVHHMLALSCIDQADERITYFRDGRRRRGNHAAFIAAARSAVGASKVLVGEGPTREDLCRFGDSAYRVAS